MVNTRTNVPVLDETLRATVLQVIQEANVLVNAALTTLQTNMNTLTERIEALMFFQTFATGELTRLRNESNSIFFIDNVQENQKIRLVSMHLYDKALEWHKQFLKTQGENVLWIDHKKEKLARFSSVFEDPMVELKNFKQEGAVQVYQEQLEVLLNRLDLTESYAVSLFIGGFKSEISMPVRMFKPNTLKDTFCLARMQEATLALTKTKHVSQYVGARTSNHSYANRYVAPSANVNKPELEEKRAKGLCFYCDQKYAPGHKCPRQLYSLEVFVDDIDEVEETMRVRGYVGKQPLHILIDCGSTHNFLDVSTAKKLPCQLTPTIPLRVDVANGSKMVSSFECKKFKWALQGNEYEADCMLIPFGGCDMVLGIQWLATLGDITTISKT
uniref:Retrotransposon gag domain-containing protein n=1 Tax=Tanacetum cinerariifolium TaxID=118510 RepID=A0A699HM57_TANCI|nr:hypothetical protein [Tanacetum cinerariifolium]